MRLNAAIQLSPAAELVQAAVADTGRTLARVPGRELSSGLHETKEFGPALRTSLVRTGIAARWVTLNASVAMTNWNRPTSDVDLVVHEPIEFVAELKVWDIGHQLFDLAKVCSVLATGVPAAFLICVAQRASDFGRLPGGELFPPAGAVREHDFVELLERHRAEWRRHIGQGRPEPTSVPTIVSTISVSVDIEIDAYRGHVTRAVEVAITDPTPVTLINGWPEGMSPLA